MDHLPECCRNDAFQMEPFPCICDRLRACEQRVKETTIPRHRDEWIADGYHNGYEVGYEAGRDAALTLAHDAVAALWKYEGVQTGPLMIGYNRALAAIDALRGE